MRRAPEPGVDLVAVSIFLPVFAALETASVRYVVVGGVAVVLHGHPRLTADLDLIIELSPAAALAAMRALSRFGLRPRAPVQIEDFADESLRRTWIRDKGMRVFSLWSPEDPLRVVDIFAEYPIPFEDLYRRAIVTAMGSQAVRVACIEDLIALKRLADRPKDRSDIEALTEIARMKRKP
jgi:hypothetical protein